MESIQPKMNHPKVEIKDIKEAPNLQVLKDRFGVDERYVIISYGNAIYSPKKELTPDLLVHELIHCERQGFSPDSAKRWWEMYLRDENFRLQEELIAYKAQFEYCCKVYKDRNKRTKIQVALAQQLASEQYGKVITFGKALELLS